MPLSGRSLISVRCCLETPMTRETDPEGLLPASSFSLFVPIWGYHPAPTWDFTDSSGS